MHTERGKLLWITIITTIVTITTLTAIATIITIIAIIAVISILILSTHIIISRIMEIRTIHRTTVQQNPRAGGYGSTQSSIYGGSRTTVMALVMERHRLTARVLITEVPRIIIRVHRLWEVPGITARVMAMETRTVTMDYMSKRIQNQRRKERKRKPGGFGKQLAKCAKRLHFVFGLVAGGVMTEALIMHPEKFLNIQCRKCFELH